MAASPGPLSHGKTPEQIVATEESLAKPPHIAFAAQTDAKLSADGTPSAVTADQIIRPDSLGRARGVANGHNDPLLGRRKLEELCRIADLYCRHSLRNVLENGLEGVLGDQLVRLERRRTVV